MSRTRRIAMLIMLTVSSFGAFAAKPVKSPKLISEPTTFVRPDGSVVRFEPRVASKSATFSASIAGQPTVDDLRPCITRSYSDWVSGSDPCTVTDKVMAVTDWGIGWVVNLDGVTSQYDLTWSAPGANLHASYWMDSRCPAQWYLDYGGPLAGDEVCWSPGTLYNVYRYPAHPAGAYTLYRSTLNGALPNDTATVLAGTIELRSGSPQNVLVGGTTQAPVIFAIKNYRGEAVSYPIDPRYPSDYNGVTFTITGPNNSVGATTTPGRAKPDASGQVSIMATVGDKLGSYTFKPVTDDAGTQSSGAIVNAVTRLEPPDDKDKEEGRGDESCPVGDPITIGLGNSFQQETDYEQTGLSMLEFVRSYNALGSRSTQMRNFWTTTYDRAILLPSVGGEPYRVRRPDGRVIPFALQNGQYVSQRAYFQETLKANGSGWQYITADNITETYDSAGRWTTIADAGGRLLTATYNTKGLLSKVTSNTGESLTFAYNTYNQLISTTDHTGRVWTYAYNGYANLTEVKDPDGMYHTYHYDSPHSPWLLTGISIAQIQNPNATARYVSWEYDSAHRVTSNYFYGNLRRYTIAYNDITGERVVTDPLGNQSTYSTRSVNGRGFIDGIVGPGFAACGLADSIVERDGDENVITATSFGRTTRFGDYDQKGQPGYRIDAADTTSAQRTDYQYDARFLDKPTRIAEPSVATGQQKITQNTYDAGGRLLQTTVNGHRPDGTPVSRTTTYEHNGPFGQLSRIDGPRTDVADVTLIEYDATTKRLKRIIDPNGVRVRDNIVYTATGQVASEDRPNGLHVTYTYYAGTDLVKSITESGASGTRTSTWTYTDRDLVASYTVSDGVNADVVTLFRYDSAGDLYEVESPGAGTISYTLDAAGNRKREARKEGVSPYGERHWIQRTFDAYGRTMDVVDVGGTHHSEHHPDGTLTSETDGRGNTTTYTYDAFKRMTAAIKPGQVTTTYAYDVADRLVGVMDANQGTTLMLYDDLGDLVLNESPDSGVTSYARDAAGNKTAQTDAMAQTSLHAYDAGNRLRSVDRPGTADDETYVYDTCVNGVGKLCSATNGIGDVVAYEYDTFGRVAKQTTNAGTLLYKYTGTGEVAEITYPSGRKVRYAYNGGRQVTTVSVVDGGNSYALARNVVHNPFGPATSWIYGNQLTETREFDKAYRPTSFASSTQSSVTYGSYDGNGFPGTRNVNGDQQSLGYDAHNRLAAASGLFGNEAYTYDGTGNRTLLTAAGGQVTYQYAAQSNRLVSDSNWTYGRDANGNETRRQAPNGSGWDLTYTSADQLLGITDLQNPATMIGGYRYNALGQRTLKSTPQGDTRFVYGISGELLAELLPSGSVVQEYVYLDGKPLALLGPPAAPATPFAVDQIIDNPTSVTGCVKKNSGSAINGSYLSCTYNYGDPSFHLSWGWAPPVSGEYDLYVRWAWSSSSQCYRMEWPATVVCAGNPGVVAGTWVSMGRRHLTGGRIDPWLESGDNYIENTLRMDAIRYVLAYKDYTDRDYKYVHTDGSGAPVRVTDMSQRVVWNAYYAPFGAATVSEDPDGNGTLQTLNLRGPGQYFDKESGLLYNYFRDYDPLVGRYLQSDPSGLAGGINSYVHAYDNPIAVVDPTGLGGRQAAPPPTNFSPGSGGNSGQRRQATRNFKRTGGNKPPPDLTVKRDEEEDPQWQPPEGEMTDWQRACAQAATIADLCGEGPWMKWGCTNYDCSGALSRNTPMSCPDPNLYPKFTGRAYGPNYSAANDPGCRCVTAGWER